MGDVLIELGRPDEALKAYQNAKSNVFKTEASKEKIVALSQEIARAFFKWADIKQNEGLEEFDSLIKLWPEVALKRNKANMIASFGQLEKALELYNKAIAEISNDAFLFKERGDIFLRLNRFTDALDDYNRAITINPGYEKAKECKSEVLVSLIRERDKIGESLRREEQGDNPE
ncbi:MAG: hypothetical protein H0V70_24070 [Ktedonobacteraceae bacterium]|nr:hypothetical protein [Ktedonobacteraceae bacterium]